MGFQEFWIQKMVISNIFFVYSMEVPMSHMLRVLMEYLLQDWVIYMENVGKYSIHGAYGYDDKYR